jgi:hypothetical protein
MTCEDNGYTFSSLPWLMSLRCFPASSQQYTIPNTVDGIPKPLGLLESSDIDVVSV